MSQPEHDAYTNEDLRATRPDERVWTTWNYAALWISMSLCIPTYMLASSLIEGGMSWWQAILTVFLGNAVVLVPMILNGHAGAQYGIPFPVLARASFGIRGANLAAILRAVVACGWFGIQTWIGGFSIFQLVRVWWPGFGELGTVFPAWMGLDTGPALTFFAFWLLNMLVVYLGIESIRKLMLFKAVFLPVAALALLVWALVVGGGLGPILAQPSKFATSAEFWAFFFPALTGMVGFWATLSLNIPDFTRYAKNQRAQVVGQAVGLPPSMTVFAFVGVVVTSATTIVYGETIWDPVVLAGRFDHPILVTLAMVSVAISTLATNIAANIVSPANDFANLAPRHINFRIGGYITGVLGVIILPWKLVADPSGYIFKWLVAYSGLLGPIGGIMIVDYYLVRAKRLDVHQLYQGFGDYWYKGGVNPAALIAFVLGVLPIVPGFLTTVELLPVETFPGWMNHVYHYAWFVGFGVSGLVYAALMRGQGEAARR